MIANTSETLSRGMEILSQKMGIVDAERFIFLIKTEGFDYTKWQREYFEGKTKGNSCSMYKKMYLRYGKVEPVKDVKPLLTEVQYE